MVGGLIAFLLTLAILSYALGDNFLFRLAIHLFIGAAAGFVLAAAFYSVIWPLLLRPLLVGSLEERLFALIPLFLAALLATKAFPKSASVGTPVMAFMVGVGAATITGGAITGTLFPQVQAAAGLFDPQAINQAGSRAGAVLINSVLILVGVTTALASFQFGRPASMRPFFQKIWNLISRTGRVFIAIAFGAIFAGVFVASLTALVERINFLVDFFRTLLVPGG
jgi:hypothetical protein